MFVLVKFHIPVRLIFVGTPFSFYDHDLFKSIKRFIHYDHFINKIEQVVERGGKKPSLEQREPPLAYKGVASPYIRRPTEGHTRTWDTVG